MLYLAGICRYFELGGKASAYYPNVFEGDPNNQVHS